MSRLIYVLSTTWRVETISLHFHGFAFPSACWSQIPHQHDASARRYSPDLRPWSLPHSTIGAAELYPPSGNASGASPEARPGLFPQQALNGNHNHSAPQSASHVPENRAERRGNSHRFWFFGEELFFAEKWARVQIWFSTAMNRQATISADRIDEPAPAGALRLCRCIISTIAKLMN